MDRRGAARYRQGLAAVSVHRSSRCAGAVPHGLRARSPAGGGTVGRIAGASRESAGPQLPPVLHRAATAGARRGRVALGCRGAALSGLLQQRGVGGTLSSACGGRLGEPGGHAEYAHALPPRERGALCRAPHRHHARGAQRLPAGLYGHRSKRPRHPHRAHGERARGRDRLGGVLPRQFQCGRRRLHLHVPCRRAARLARHRGGTQRFPRQLPLRHATDRPALRGAIGRRRRAAPRTRARHRHVSLRHHLGFQRHHPAAAGLPRARCRHHPRRGRAVHCRRGAGRLLPHRRADVVIQLHGRGAGYRHAGQTDRRGAPLGRRDHHAGDRRGLCEEVFLLQHLRWQPGVCRGG